MIYGIGGALGRIISIITIPLLTFHLTPSDFGVIAILLMLGTFLAPIFSMGLPTSIGVTYYSTEDLDDRNKVLWTAFLILMLASTVLVVFAWFGKEYINQFFFNQNNYETVIFLSLTATALSLPIQVWQLALQFSNRSQAYVASTFLTALVSAGLIFYFVIYLNQSVTGYFSAMVIGQIFGLACFTGLGVWGCKFSYSTFLGKKMLVYGAPMIASFFFLFVIQNGARYPLEYYFGLSAVGIYMIGASFGLVISIGTNAFSTAWTPFALSFSEKQDKAIKVLPDITFAYLFFGGGLVILFFYFAKPMTLLLVAEEYRQSYSVIGLSAATQFLTSLFTMILPPLYFGKKVYLVAYVQASTALVTTCLYITLIPVWGVFGAALAVFLGHFIMVILLLLVIYFDKSLLKMHYDFKKYSILFGLLLTLVVPSFFATSDGLLGSVIFAIFGSLISILILIYKFKSEFNAIMLIILSIFKKKFSEAD